jgi:DNA-binding protein YbaB
MLRKVVCALVVLLLAAGISLAAEIKGKIKKVDAATNTITVTVDGQDNEYKIADDCKFIDANGKEVAGGLKAPALKSAGAEVTLTEDNGKVTKLMLSKGSKEDK